MTTIEHIEGKYEILEKIKEGGMGAIYRVRHRLLDEIRVIKILRQQLEGDEDIRQRFTQEARVAIRLRHPNIAQLYDFSVDDDGNAYIVMEYIDGITIEEMLVRIGPPPIGVAVEIMRQSLAALGHLHRKGIVHRDIAPDNLMLTRQDEAPLTVKLIDMGIAKVLKGSSAQTMAGVFLGKVRYSSPEQLRGEAGTIDARSDLYSLGVVFYELLTTHGPFRASTVPSLVAAHLYNQPLPFTDTDPRHRIPEDLQAIVLKALSKAQGERHASADEMSDALAGVGARFPVDTEAIARAFVLPDGPTDRISIQKLGSTQNRLDRQFGVGTTRTRHDDATSAVARAAGVAPQAAAAQAGPPPPPAHRAERPEREPTLARQVTSFLASAEKLIGLGQIEEAKLQLGTVLQLDPGNPNALRLLEKAESHTTAHPVAPSATEALASAMADAEALLARGDVGAARDLVERVESERGLSRALEDLRARIVKREQQLARDRVARHGEELLESGQPAAAVQLLEEFLASAAGRDRKVDNLLMRAQASLREQEEAVQRQRALEDAEGAIALVLENDDFSSARDLLEAARERCGERPELDALATRIKEAEQRRLESDVLSLLSEARALADEARFDEAIDTLEHALALRPEDDGIRRALLATARTQQRFAREQERQRVAAEAVGRVRELMAAGKLDESAAELEKAYEMFGETLELAAAGADLTAARAHERERRVRTLLRDAARHVEQDAFPAAIERLEEAQGLAPDNSEIPDMLAKTRKAFEEHQESQRRQAAIHAALKEIRFLLQGGRLDAAEDRLARALVECGDAMELAGLRQRIITLRQQEREAHVKLLLREAAECVENFRFPEALARMEEALRLKPGDPTLLEILGKMQTAWREHEATQRRQRVVAEEAAAIETLLAAGHLDRALRRATALSSHLGEDPALAAARERVEAAVVARRNLEEQLGELVTTARRALARQDPDQALPVLEKAMSLAVASPEVTILLAEAQALQTRLAEQRRRTQELLDATDAIELRLRAGELEEAERALALAEKLYSGEAVMRGLRQRLEHQRNQAGTLQMVAMIEEARALAAGEKYEKAILEAQRAQALDPANQEVKDLLQELPRRQAAATIEGFLMRHALEDAAHALAFAEKRHGTADALLLPLRQRLEEAQARRGTSPAPDPPGRRPAV